MSPRSKARRLSASPMLAVNSETGRLSAPYAPTWSSRGRLSAESPRTNWIGPSIMTYSTSRHRTNTRVVRLSKTARTSRSPDLEHVTAPAPATGIVAPSTRSKRIGAPGTMWPSASNAWTGSALGQRLLMMIVSDASAARRTAGRGADRPSQALKANRTMPTFKVRMPLDPTPRRRAKARFRLCGSSYLAILRRTRVLALPRDRRRALRLPHPYRLQRKAHAVE